MKILPIFLFITILSCAAPLFAQGTITLAWDPDAESITGFKLYQSKTSGIYTAGTPVATFTPGTLTTGTIPKPTSFGKYFYVLTAYSLDTTVTPNATMESGFSNEVSVLVTPKSPKLNTAILALLECPLKAIKWALGITPKGHGLRVLKA